jgi:hypothetical protein
MARLTLKLRSKTMKWLAKLDRQNPEPFMKNGRKQPPTP